MRTRILPIVLPPSTYRQLEREARAEERDPLQHARWILKRALSDPTNERSASPATSSRELEAIA